MTLVSDEGKRTAVDTPLAYISDGYCRATVEPRVILESGFEERFGLMHAFSSD